MNNLNIKKNSNANLQLSLLLVYQQSHHYRFITINLASHQKVNVRENAVIASILTDIFGWNRCFKTDDIDYLI